MGLRIDSKYPAIKSFTVFRMTKPRILLISSQYLFGESMETILRADKEVELIGPSPAWAPKQTTGVWPTASSCVARIRSSGQSAMR